MPINILCNKLSLYEYRGNLYLIKDLRKINVLKKKVLSQLNPASELSCLPGCQGLAFLLSLPPTGVHSLHPPSGPEFALLLGSLHLQQQHSIPRAMA